MNKLFIAILFVILFTPAVCFANVSDFFHSQQDRIGVDKFAHFGAGYVISDLLKGDKKLKWEDRLLIVTALAAAKEEFIDHNWDRKDFWATVAGGVLSELKLVIKF